MNKTLISLLLALGYPAHAEENILDAEAAIKNGAPLAAYQHLAPHPLYPYLEARYYRDNLATTPVSTLVAFLKKYPNDPFSTTLAKQAYPYWAAGGENDAIIASYSPGYADEPLECQYRLALMSRGKTREAIKDSDKLLASDKSLSAECNTLYDRLAHSGHINPAQHAERFRLAMANNNTLIASYLAGNLQGAAAQAAQTWLDIDQNRLPIESAYSLTDPDWRSALLAQQLGKRLKKDPLALAQATNAATMGSLFFGYFNDSLYWVVNRMMGIADVKTQMIVWSIPTTIAWGIGGALVALANLVFGKGGSIVDPLLPLVILGLVMAYVMHMNRQLNAK